LGRACSLAAVVAAAASLLFSPARAQPSLPPATIERVQQASETTSAGATSLTLAWHAPTEEGNLLVLAAHVWWNSTVGAIGVPPGWTLAERADGGGFPPGVRPGRVSVALYYREGAPSQSGAVTVTALDPEDRIKMVLAEYRGVRSVGSLDQRAKSTGPSGPPQTGMTAPTTQPDELWLGAVTNAAGLHQCDPTNGFVQVAMPTSGASTLGVYERVTSAVDSAGLSVQLRLPCSDTSTLRALDWAGVVATFHADVPGKPPAACTPIDRTQCIPPLVEQREVRPEVFC